LFLTYIEKDIVKVYGIKYKQRIIDLIRVLSSLNASIVNYNEICSITNFYYKELKEVIGILEDTYIIKVIKPFHKNLVSEVRKNPKIYFIDTGLRNFITGRFDFSEEEFGKLLETYVLNQLREEVKYWRTTAKAEVDFVLINRTIPIEVKVNYKITRAIRSFISKYKPENAFIINLNSFHKTKINNTIIFIVPASLFSP